MLTVKNLSFGNKSLIVTPEQELAVKTYARAISQITKIQEPQCLCVCISAIQEVEMDYGTAFMELYHLPLPMKIIIINQINDIILNLLSDQNVEPRTAKRALNFAVDILKHQNSNYD